MAPYGPEMQVEGRRDTLIGQAAAYLLLFAALGALSGLWTAIFGRRSRLLTVPVIIMFVVFIGAIILGMRHLKAG